MQTQRTYRYYREHNLQKHNTHVQHQWSNTRTTLVWLYCDHTYNVWVVMLVVWRNLDSFLDSWGSLGRSCQTLKCSDPSRLSNWNVKYIHDIYALFYLSNTCTNIPRKEMEHVTNTKVTFEMLVIKSQIFFRMIL